MTDGTSNITLIQQSQNCERPVLEEVNEYLHLGVIVDDAEACWRRLEELGAEFSSDSIKQRNETQAESSTKISFKVLDLDGNVST